MRPSNRGALVIVIERRTTRCRRAAVRVDCLIPEEVSPRRVPRGCPLSQCWDRKSSPLRWVWPQHCERQHPAHRALMASVLYSIPWRACRPGIRHLPSGRAGGGAVGPHGRIAVRPGRVGGRATSDQSAATGGWWPLLPRAHPCRGVVFPLGRQLMRNPIGVGDEDLWVAATVG